MRTFPLLILAATVCVTARAASRIQYERDIAPVLRTYCSGCHNAVDLEGDFSVETYGALRKGGSDEGDPVVPGDAAKSFLIRSIEHASTPRMPPKDEPQVPPAEIALLKKWIAAGAPGPAKDESILQKLVVAPLPAGKNVVSPATAVAVSRDASLLAVGRYGRVELRRAADAGLIREIGGLPGKVNALQFAPDGKHIVVATGITGLNGVARLHRVEDGALVREFGGHRDVLFAVAVSPDGATLATGGYDNSIKLWNLAEGPLLRSIDVHNGAVFDLAFSPDGRALASASADQTVKLWRVSDGVRLDTLNQPQGEMIRVAFTPDSKHIVAAGGDKRVYLWRWVSRTKPAINPLLESRFAHETAITALALTSDGAHLFTAAKDRSLKVWNVPALVEQHAFAEQPDAATALTVIPGAPTAIVTRMDGSIEMLPVIERRAPGLKTGVATGGATVAATQSTSELAKVSEVEPNDSPESAQRVTLPTDIGGAVAKDGDADVYRFTAAAGEEFMFQVNAARSKSRLDSRLEVLHPDGSPVEQVTLRAVRESWFTFRGKDSDTSDDFRVHDWERMELNEFLYANGEVVKLWMCPRGPDSGFKVHPGRGKRQPAFGTTALVHALGEPCYVVQALPPGTQPVPNGLPVYHVHYENDDDPLRRWGADSELLFTAPKSGEYLIRLTDVRGFGGATNFHYTLTMRERRPDFTLAVGGRNPKVSRGSGQELSVSATRLEGFDGPIRVDIANLPAGFHASLPIEIEAGQNDAEFVIWSDAEATDPDDAADKAVRVSGTATIAGREVVHGAGNLGNIQLTNAPKLAIEILAGDNATARQASPESPIEFFIRPGETITALVRATRSGFKDRIELGKEDAGRNLPHGVYVDNIGLNGLLIVEGQTERDFVITASPVAKPGTRLFHLKASAADGQASRPAILHVLGAEGSRASLPAGAAAER